MLGGTPSSSRSCTWPCEACTVLNDIRCSSCEVCGTTRGINRVNASEVSSLAARPERRLGRFVRRPSFEVDTRIERALSQRLYILQMEKHEASSGATFKILGSTGNAYTVKLCQEPECNCPDFLKGRGVCKHILFVWLRVLQCREDDPRIWQTALLTTELSAVDAVFARRATSLPLAAKAIREAYRQAVGGSDYADDSAEAEMEDSCRRHRKLLDDEDCPVCFEAMAVSEEQAGKLTFCCNCGNNFHGDCIRRWQQASTGNCPLCRDPWKRSAKHVLPGQPLPSATLAVPIISGHVVPGRFSNYFNLRNISS